MSRHIGRTDSRVSSATRVVRNCVGNVNAPALATPSPLATSVAAADDDGDDDDDEKYCEARFSNDVSAEYCCDPIIDGRARNDGSADDE